MSSNRTVEGHMIPHREYIILVCFCHTGAIVRLPWWYWSNPKRYGINFIVNSLAPGEFQWKFGFVIFKQILVIDGWGISCEIALIWMSLDLNDEKSTLVQVMAWSQCQPKSFSPYGVTRPYWVKQPLPNRKCNKAYILWYDKITD